MALSVKQSFSRRLFLWLLLYSLLLAGVTVTYQYQRERQFKADEMNARLQVVNSYIISELRRGKSVADLDLQELYEEKDMRVSVIAPDGGVIYDNTLDSGTENHLGRPEVEEARKRGNGYTVRRHSESNGKTYFYSALLDPDNGTVVRTAVPHNLTLRQLLQADFSFLWFMGVLTAVMCVLGYFATRRIGRLQEESDRLMRQQEKDRIKKQLTNNISHELKTPVASVQVCVETLLEHPELNPEKRTEFLNRCLHNTQRLRRLLDDVALITRMEDGDHAIAREPLDLCDIIEETVADSRDAAKARGMVIRADLSGPFPLSGNQSLLASVFHNLIANAMAYSGGTLLTIRADGSERTVTVTDNGCGVSDEHLPRLFERFYRVDKGRSRAAGGTGLGLAIVKNAVIFHGGSISVSNREGGGLEFSMCFTET